MYGLAHLVDFQHYFHHFLQVSLSLLISAVTANLTFEPFALDQKTFALLLETTLFLSKRHAISAYILSHLTDFHSSMSLHKYCLVSTIFSDSSLMTTRPTRPNHGTPAGRETFTTHFNLIHVIIRYICIGHFTHTG